MIILAIPVVATVVFIKAWDTISERFITAPKESAETRIMLAQAAVKMANDKALGIGLNNFGLKINAYPYNSRFSEESLQRRKSRLG